MTTQSKTRNSFERLVRQKGASIHWHRESGGIDCPCLTPEGFRDPEWHILNPPGSYHIKLSDYSGDVLTWLEFLLTNYTLNSNENGIVIGAFTDSGTGAHFQDWGAEVPASGVETNLEAYQEIVNSALILPGPDFVYLGRLKPTSDPTNNDLFVFTTAPGVQLDWNTGDVLLRNAVTGTWPFLTVNPPPIDSLLPPFVCNDDGKINTIVQDAVVKGFVQPAFISTRSRSNQLLMESFGEIQADDHIGIFPIDFDALQLDFSDWSNSGTDWIDFNDMRFIAVAWNLLPAPDNADVSHHWEVALRRVNKDEPA